MILFLVMMALRIINQIFQKSFIPVAIGVAAFVLILVITLDLAAASLILILFLAAAIFQNSFSGGWLFLFGVLILLPSIKVGESGISVYEIILIVLALTSLVSISVESVKLPKNRLGGFFILFLLLGLGLPVTGLLFGKIINWSIFRVVFMILIFLILLVSFQYFFQTLKRLHKFFILVIATGSAHVIFGIISFLAGWQTAGGFGFSVGKVQHLAFGKIERQINGFLGDGFSLGVGENALAPLLLIIIPLTVGMILALSLDGFGEAQKPELAERENENSDSNVNTISFSQVNSASQINSNSNGNVPSISDLENNSKENGVGPAGEVQSIDSLAAASEAKPGDRFTFNLKKKLVDSAHLIQEDGKKAAFNWNEKIKNLQKSIINLKNQEEEDQENGLSKEQKTVWKFFLFILLFAQIVGLVLTFSYISLVVLGIGMFVIGVLLKNRSIILATATSLVVVSIIFPSIGSSVVEQSTLNISGWFSGFEEIRGDWLLGQGWQVKKDVEKSAFGEIYNSYFFIWKNFGIFGLLIFLAILVQYLKDLHALYRKSDGEKRIWLIMILAIFFEFLFLGFSSNALLFGPAALVFWLLHGAALNLKCAPMVGDEKTKLYY